MVKKILIGLGILFLLFVVGSIVLISLGGATKRGGYYLESPTGLAPLLSPEFAGEKNTGEGTPEAPNRLVIKTGTMSMVVKDIGSTVKNIVQYAEDKGGWVVSSSVTEREKVPSGSITVRVPSELFDEAITYFRGLAEKITYEGTRGQDVTEEYTDLQSRLRNLEAAETQLLKIMGRSGTIPDVLAVQKELTSVRDQIERTKGRIQYLEESAEMATVTVNLALSEELLPIPPSEKWRPKYILLQAWHSVLTALRSISYLLIWIGVYGLIWIPLGLIIWQVRKYRSKKKKA